MGFCVFGATDILVSPSESTAGNFEDDASGREAVSSEEFDIFLDAVREKLSFSLGDWERGASTSISLFRRSISRGRLPRTELDDVGDWVR